MTALLLSAVILTACHQEAEVSSLPIHNTAAIFPHRGRRGAGYGLWHLWRKLSWPKRISWSLDGEGLLFHLVCRHPALIQGDRASALSSGSPNDFGGNH